MTTCHSEGRTERQPLRRLLLTSLLVWITVSPDSVLRAQPSAQPAEDRTSATERARNAAAGTVTGRVVDDTGNPIEGALVVVSEQRRVPDLKAATGKTDMAGRFSIEIPDQFRDAPLRQKRADPQVHCQCFVHVAGRPVSMQSFLLREQDGWSADLPQASLTKGHNLSFRVWSPEGKPLPGVDVRVGTEFGHKSLLIPPSEILKLRIRKSDDSGVATFPGIVGSMGHFQITATSPEFGVLTTAVAASAEKGETFDLLFKAKGSVVGQIRCTDPKQLSHLKLEVSSSGRTVRLPGVGLIVHEPGSKPVTVQPDQKGHFRVNGLPPGGLIVHQVIDEETVWLLHGPVVNLNIEPGGVTEYAGELKPGIPVDGYVIDRQMNELLGDSTIELKEAQWMQTQQVFEVKTQGDGRFQAVVPPGHYQVTARTMIPGFSRFRVQTFDVKPDDERAEVKVFVPRTLSMQAALVDEDDRPVGNAWVAAMSDNKLLMLKQASDAGTFEAWLADISRADVWQVRIGKRRFKGTVLKKVPLKLQVSLKTAADPEPVPSDSDRD
ncbi:hypothetical protein GC176_20085 [bacterium]|nr:hypothetical protein [bacterium]